MSGFGTYQVHRCAAFPRANCALRCSAFGSNRQWWSSGSWSAPRAACKICARPRRWKKSRRICPHRSAVKTPQQRVRLAGGVSGMYECVDSTWIIWMKAWRLAMIGLPLRFETNWSLAAVRAVSNVVCSVSPATSSALTASYAFI